MLTSMMTSPGSRMAPAQHLNYLDGWRGLAIVFLLVGHFFPVPGINMGAIGVNLFFVLSGILMARLLFIREVPLASFYKRRIARIFPASLCFIAIIVAVRLAWGKPVDFTEVLAAATFVNNYFVGVLGKYAMPFGHFWSLCVEEHSYVVLSLIALAARRQWLPARGMVLAATAIIAACAAGYGLANSDADYFALSMHSEVAAFGIFASAALLLCLEGRTLPRLPLLAYVALGGFGVAMHWWAVPGPLRTLAGVGAFALLINLLSAAPATLHAALSVRPLRQLGLWSFSIYVWQQPFYLLSKYHGLPPVAGLAMALGAGVGSYYLLEHPAREWINRTWSPEPAQPEPVQASAA
jgi:peptidoglycan/LPS O-acetylase OafA/YrhL